MVLRCIRARAVSSLLGWRSVVFVCGKVKELAPEVVKIGSQIPFLVVVEKAASTVISNGSVPHRVETRSPDTDNQITVWGIGCTTWHCLDLHLRTCRNDIPTSRQYAEHGRELGPTKRNGSERGHGSNSLFSQGRVHSHRVILADASFARGWHAVEDTRRPVEENDRHRDGVHNLQACGSVDSTHPVRIVEALTVSQHREFIGHRIHILGSNNGNSSSRREATWHAAEQKVV